MRKLGFIILIGALFAGIAAAQLFWPIYWITGSVQNADDGTTADGQYVHFYKNDADRAAGKLSLGVVGSGRYMINTFNLNLSSLDVGQTYYAAIPNTNPADPSEGYGAMPVAIPISGKGYDEAPLLVFNKGVDPFGQVAIGTPPVIRQVWFGNRIYQKTLVARGETFIVGPTPTIRASIEATGTSGINASNITILVNEGTARARTYTMAAANITQTVYATAAKDAIQSLAVEYSIPESDPLPENEDSQVAVRAWDAGNTASTSEACTVTVLGGPLRVVGSVLVYPSPFSQRRHGTCTIQYALSAKANVDIYIYAPSGQLVKKITRFSGMEGGSAGINNVVWDGRTESGMLAGNAVYVGTLVARDEGKLLATFKFTILD